MLRVADPLLIAFDPAYHRPPKGSASEIRWMPRGDLYKWMLSWNLMKTTASSGRIGIKKRQ